MFDIGLLELFLVLAVGLIVLGPDRLPEIVKSVTRSIRWLRKAVSSTKQEMSKNIGLDEIYQDLRNEEVMKKTDINEDQSKEN
jgi:sec-independent protein translocase protein TatB|tara:strand:- start:189 stop:437 length:249 start_codon:yes stop_codon:yes gene_type:complete